MLPQNEQINSSMFKAEVEGEQGGEKTNVCGGKGKGPWLLLPLCSSLTERLWQCCCWGCGVEVNWIEVALS